MHVLAHQVMALILQEGGISRHKLLPWVEAAYPFSSIRPERLQELIDTMLERQILYEADGLLSLGQRGEKLYGRKNFFELYAVFTSPPVMRVQHGKEDVGYIQALFVSMHDRKQGSAVLPPVWTCMGGGPDRLVEGRPSRAPGGTRSRAELARAAGRALDAALPRP